MQLCVVERRVENALLLFRSALHGDGLECFLPSVACLFPGIFKSECRLFFLQIFTGIGNGDERDSHLHLNLFAVLAVEVEEIAYLVACHLFVVARVELVFPVVAVPCRFDTGHGRLLFPISAGVGFLRHAHDEIDREYGLRIVAERAEQSHSLNFGLADLLNHSSDFVGQSVADVEQDMPFALLERVSLDGRAERG